MLHHVRKEGEKRRGELLILLPGEDEDVELEAVAVATFEN